MAEEHIAQKQTVLGHMRLYGPITPLEALKQYGIMRLGARIHDLEKDGHSINHGKIKQNGKWFSSYSLNNCDTNGQYALL